MKRFFNKTWFFALSVALLVGCYPAGPDYVEDLDVVYTSFNKDFDFQSKSTYSLPDKIVIDVQIDKNGDTTIVYMKDKYAQQYLGTIDSNLQGFGWTKVDIDKKPSVVVTPAAIETTNFYYSYWYDWWYGGWYPGWGWYYPPYYSVSSYKTGTFIITMADPNEDNPINKSKAAWIVAMNGLLGSNDQSRAVKGINQAFTQSPYLKIN